ncbi:unnamed protein product [Moneuplotes crassus]|uniref:Uncharacterized protein n=1 Tax=Euplotes crassus TaxID=5936 RepID=A0AAD1U2V6_EUPCR|nr:unnamed protein product [Moneuplotes crassus]
MEQTIQNISSSSHKIDENMRDSGDQAEANNCLIMSEMTKKNIDQSAIKRELNKDASNEQKRMILRIRELNKNSLYSNLTFEEKNKIIRSNLPINLYTHFERNQATKPKPIPKKSDIDIMKTSVADLNKSFKDFRKSMIDFKGIGKNPRSISPFKRENPAEKERTASEMKKPSDFKDLNSLPNNYTIPVNNTGSQKRMSKKELMKRARAGVFTCLIFTENNTTSRLQYSKKAGSGDQIKCSD